MLMIISYRLPDSIVEESLLSSTWNSLDRQSKLKSGSSVEDLTLSDPLAIRFKLNEDKKFGTRFPCPISILFRPKCNLRYRSRYRVICQYGNVVEFTVEGRGTFDEIRRNSSIIRIYQ